MSKNLETVIQRAISDAAFRRQLQANPEAALRGFKLTADEVASLLERILDVLRRGEA